MAGCIQTGINTRRCGKSALLTESRWIETFLCSGVGIHDLVVSHHKKIRDGMVSVPILMKKTKYIQPIVHVN